MNKRIMGFLLLIILPCFAASAQQERTFLPVNWKAIKKEVSKNPEHVKDLVARLSAQKLDTTLTFTDRILAFYGQSFLTNDSEEIYMNNMYKLEEAGKLEECLAMAKKMLEINPLNLNALNTTGNLLYKMAKDSTRWDNITIADAKPYFDRAMRIFNTIAMTGDGSPSHPFYVTKVSDEYCFMRYYLDLWKYKQQVATDCCDVITLEGSSKYYDQPTISFEITRVYELEQHLFK